MRWGTKKSYVVKGGYEVFNLRICVYIDPTIALGFLHRAYTFLKIGTVRIRQW